MGYKEHRYSREVRQNNKHTAHSKKRTRRPYDAVNVAILCRPGIVLPAGKSCRVTLKIKKPAMVNDVNVQRDGRFVAADVLVQLAAIFACLCCCRSQELGEIYKRADFGLKPAQGFGIHVPLASADSCCVDFPVCFRFRARNVKV